MNYTQSDSYSTHAGTGHRMHDDAKAVPTAWSAADANMVIWSLMQLLADAGVSPVTFDPATPGSYDRVSQAVQILGGVRLSAFTGTNQSLSANGWQKLPGGLVLQWGYLATTNGNFSFPIAFPTACLAVLGSNANSQGSNNDNTFAYVVSASQFYIASKASTGGVGNYPAYWLAIGY